MDEPRRTAFRLAVTAPGTLSFSRHRAPCVVLDISAAGARVRLTPPTLIPDRVRLSTRIAGHSITLAARLSRAEPRGVVALVFETESGKLQKLLHEAQRLSI